MELSDELKNLGLNLILDFITIDEEAEIYSRLTKLAVNNRRNRNSIQRFGSSKPYGSNMISNIIPKHFHFVLDRLLEKKLVDKKPDSVSVNEYHIGQFISPHIDSKASGEVISILSLLSDATMVFSSKNHVKHKVILPPRSLVQMRGEIRNKWNHSVEPLQALRYSIVFRVAT